MNQRVIFLISAFAAFLLLSCVCLSMLTLGAIGHLNASDGISAFNLLVDIGVGFFTIWGLYWAASEFAEVVRKPDLRLLPGRIEEHPPPTLTTFEVTSITHRIRGWHEAPTDPLKRRPHIVCGLFLENGSPRAGRYICLVIRAPTTPKPTFLKLFAPHIDWHGEYKVPDEEADTEVAFTSVQFEESFVVYQLRALVGALIVEWDPDLPNDMLPENVVLDYDIHALDGVSHGKIGLHVEWDEDIV